MTYEYKCDNKDCEKFDEIVQVKKSIKDSSKKEYCEKCSKELIRVFSTSIKTNDGIKI